MSAIDIAKDLVALCLDGKATEAIEKHYAPNIVSVEAQQGAPEFPRIIEGKEAVLQKSKFWASQTEVHNQKIEGPFPHGDDKFALIFEIDATMPGMGRNTLREVAVYDTTNDKIVREEFFYTMG